MNLVLSPPKLVLLAVQLAASADIGHLASLVSQHSEILRRDLVLRILLTYLPETLASSKYVPFVRDLAAGELPAVDSGDLDCGTLEALTDDEASKKIRKLHLLPLAWEECPLDAEDDPLTLFLMRRAYRVDEEAGLLPQLPDLMLPFLDHNPGIRTWAISTLLPLLRRNYDYYPQSAASLTLAEFHALPDQAAIAFLLSETGVRDEDIGVVGRDLRGLISPWLYGDDRWRRSSADEGQSATSESKVDSLVCPGWESVLQWLIIQASSNWRVAVQAVEQWNGPGDVDLENWVDLWYQQPQQQYLDHRYARAALASAYLVPEGTMDALAGAHKILVKITAFLDQGVSPSLQSALSMLPVISNISSHGLISAKNAASMRHDLLAESNPLTSPTRAATELLNALILSAFILTRAGSPCTVKRAGDLTFLQDEREQKAEATKLIHIIANRALKNDDAYWTSAREELLWLRSWGTEATPEADDAPATGGIFGKVRREFLEMEILKALLLHTRYSLARSIYEGAPERPLSAQALQDTVFTAAMNAYDNASNPNRTKGGLKKCDDIVHAFPATIRGSLPAARRMEALLAATHALSEYRLVLKQGEPFSPVVLRVHSDPVSILKNVLEQNSGSYTRIQDLLDIGANMIRAGLTSRGKSRNATSAVNEAELQIPQTERRITAMCIEAALAEDDFETAYSYVVNRLTVTDSASSAQIQPDTADNWSWKAALQAGQYVRTSRSQRPTHLGTASGNLDIRHLEQRIECLSTALRIAPAAQLQEILKTFRRCEEQLDSAMAEEAAREDAWDAAGDLQSPGLPGSFEPAPRRRAKESAPSAGKGGGDEAPMSLFDLSRAATRAAQRNFTSMSALQRQSDDKEAEDGAETQAQPRVRKRDQLRDAAMGTLVSGVGWLVGAQPVDRTQRDQ